MFQANAKSRRPKFLLYVKFNELMNIPQSDGMCSVRWTLKDGTGTSGHGFGSELENKLTTTPGVNQSRGQSPKARVSRHKAVWNYELPNPVQVKLQVDRNGHISSKVLHLDVYLDPAPTRSNSVHVPSLPRPSTASNFSFVPGTGSENPIKSNTKRMFMGYVSLNIADYIREDEVYSTSRFLLKESKVNSIINMSVRMEIVRGTYNDFAIPRNSKSRIHGSLNTDLNDLLEGSTEIASPISSSSRQFGDSTNDANGRPLSMMSSTINNSGSTMSSANMSPLVDQLYQSSFDISWDPRPGEYTPRDCIDDLLKGGNGWAKNEEGVNLIDMSERTQKKYDLTSNDYPML
ncbi:hypothetical protein Kpol_1018p108 [Vanderwaltozyma polyspora DSM 70294]|uniref:C2 NT-type domain-containing protein n=1 Tax=Vanderwaltozyma polyspora (strain ATCC 22028 / DSM 70294 / BCRC 21397 / CBS 2163 / NBRC 10782 / NRRL Y-8283 / UCD 57-17) TaxID=436907 RepID=A7TDV5_VANPO|nr:uncharacterized protein Kpol_1018p108 [Vanderwaltozyma polyspora DSM 70294]EDO19575.1 hypothetical protein Kpol_1018p108 [Vanderwaltozyma polyspora DSM 70294]